MTQSTEHVASILALDLGSTTGWAVRNGRCRIKGNIRKSGRIYHLPGTASYDDTRIDPSKGERWFCTESEAREAGWRPARD